MVLTCGTIRSPVSRSLLPYQLPAPPNTPSFQFHHPIGRVLVGLGIGIASTVVPILVGELAPTHLRAKLVTVNVLAITTGQFLSYLINYGFAHVDGNWRYAGVRRAEERCVGLPIGKEEPAGLLNERHGLCRRDINVGQLSYQTPCTLYTSLNRWMLGISAAPAVFQLAGLFLLPETKPKRADGKGKSSILWRQLKRKSVWKQLHIGRLWRQVSMRWGVNFWTTHGL